MQSHVPAIAATKLNYKNAATKLTGTEGSML